MDNILAAHQVIKSNKQLGSLWISSLYFVSKLTNLNPIYIKCICSVTGTKISFPKNFQHLHIFMEDDPNVDEKEFIKCCQISYNFIQFNRNKGSNVLIHCMLGVSRSVALCSYYLMKKYNLSYEQAIKMITKTGRPIKINLGFQQILKQLKFCDKKNQQKEKQLFKNIHTPNL